MGDWKYAWRQLRKSPGFAVTAVLTLALGIGATTAIFSLFDQVMLRLLPVEKPRELVRLDWHGRFSGSMSNFGGDIGNYYSYPMYRDLRERNQVFSGMLAAVRTGLGVSWHNQAANVDAELVSGNYFEVLGLRPAAGRLLTGADETAKGANPVAVLSYDYWRTQMSGSRAVLGQTLAINGHPFTIVGVAPENFHTAIGGYRPDVFVPVTMVDTAMPWMAPRHNLDNRQSIWLTLVARLKPGETAAQAQAGLAPLWHALRVEEAKQYTSSTEQFRHDFAEKTRLLVVDDARGFSPGRMDLATPLTILLSMAGLLMAICTLNVATLLLLRSSARAREISMRYALGADSGRVLRQLLVEGGLLGVGGAAGALALAPVLGEALVRLMTHADPGSEPYSASLNVPVLLFALGLGMAVSVLFSIAPAVHFLRPDLAAALRQKSGTASRETQRFRKAAVGVQIALSVLLLAGAGLFVRTLNHLRDQPVGFDTKGMATFGLDPTLAGYGEDRTRQTVMAAVDALRGIPGVEMAAATTDPELAGDSEIETFAVQGHVTAPGENTSAEEPWITPGYFAVLKQPVLDGREFTLADAKGAPKVAVVNLAFAKRYYGSAPNALGRLIGSGRGKPDTTIVGVVGDTKHQDLRSEVMPAVYRPYLQQPDPVGVQMYVRAGQTPESVEPAIRQAMHRLDPVLVVDGLRTMEAQVDVSAEDEQALALLAASFAALAAMLAAVGLYGVLAYSTQSRTREIGVRLALGAPRRSVVTLVMREMAWIAGIAAVAALPATVGLAQLFRSQLYGVSTWDPVTMAAALGLTAVMLLAAAALPARRATAVDPMEALRAE